MISARPSASPSPTAALRSMSPKPSRSPGNEAVLPTRKWKIRNYRYTKLKNSEDIGSGQGIEFTSKTADKHRLELIADKKPFHYVNGGIGGESYGFEIGISRAELPGVDVNADYARFSTDDSGALASDEYIAIIGNRIWEQFSIILDIKNNSLYLKKLPSTHL